MDLQVAHQQSQASLTGLFYEGFCETKISPLLLRFFFEMSTSLEEYVVIRTRMEWLCNNASYCQRLLQQTLWTRHMSYSSSSLSLSPRKRRAYQPGHRELLLNGKKSPFCRYEQQAIQQRMRVASEISAQLERSEAGRREDKQYSQELLARLQKEAAERLPPLVHSSSFTTSVLACTSAATVSTCHFLLLWSSAISKVAPRTSGKGET